MDAITAHPAKDNGVLRRRPVVDVFIRRVLDTFITEDAIKICGATQCGQKCVEYSHTERVISLIG